jgi:hypothetical protein
MERGLRVMEGSRGRQNRQLPTVSDCIINGIAISLGFIVFNFDLNKFEHPYNTYE